MRLELRNGTIIKWIDIVSDQVKLNENPPSGSNNLSVATTAWVRPLATADSCTKVN
jgi:hypothetical protein